MRALEGLGMSSSATSLALSAGAACIVGGLIGGAIVKKKLSVKAADPLPEKWVKVGEIKELLIYPVKSIPAISVKEAVLARLGLKAVDNPFLRDRVFLIVDKDGVAVSQKKIPMLALLTVQLDGNKLTLIGPADSSESDITIDIPNKDNSSSREAMVMGEKIKDVLDCGDKIAAWLVKVTGTQGLRLVYHVEENSVRGSVKRNRRFHTYRENHTGAFHDETSYMLMTDESVDAVNENLAAAGNNDPVSHTNFRPTIVVSGVPEPFAEDFWGYIRIGPKDTGPIMKTSVPCQRCKLTTVDPVTGTFRTDGEPLRTLYRMKRQVGDEKIAKLVSKSAVIGAHFGVFTGEGDVVRVGDPVYVALQ